MANFITGLEMSLGSEVDWVFFRMSSFQNLLPFFWNAIQNWKENVNNTQNACFLNLLVLFFWKSDCGNPQGKSHGAKKWNNGSVRVVLKSTKNSPLGHLINFLFFKQFLFKYNIIWLKKWNCGRTLFGGTPLAPVDVDVFKIGLKKTRTKKMFSHQMWRDRLYAKQGHLLLKKIRESFWVSVHLSISFVLLSY